MNVRPVSGPSDSGYAGVEITFATMHGKQRLAREPFQRLLGAHVTAPAAIDTDRFGTFAGDIPRTLSPLDAARAKARLAMTMAGTGFGLASEGSFVSTFGSSLENTELLLFVDDRRELELVELRTDHSPVAAGRAVHSADELVRYATAIGFPAQGVVLQAHHGATITVVKNSSTCAELVAAFDACLAGASTVIAIPDFRADRAPSRAAAIASLCARMAQRLATPCPGCACPGFGIIGCEAGAPCSACGAATQIIMADVLGCGRCDVTRRRLREPAVADPRWCGNCNP